MSAACTAAFCARRFAAANHKDAARISFSRCRTCARGSAEYEITERTKHDVSVKTINTPQAKPEHLRCIKQVMSNKPYQTQKKDEELQDGSEL
jgi:hypothetical protein